MDNISFYKIGVPAGLLASKNIGNFLGPDITAYFFVIALFFLWSIPYWDDQTHADRCRKKRAAKPLLAAVVILFAGLAQSGM